MKANGIVIVGGAPAQSKVKASAGGGPHAALVSVLAAAALLGLAPGLRGAEPLRFKVNLTRPMLADGQVRLEPGVYDVVFDPSPAGPPRFIAVFSRGGIRIATAPGRLKGAPAVLNVADIKVGASPWAIHDTNVRKSGEIVPLNFEVKVKAERAFYEALVTEIGMPALDASSKAPATITFTTPKVTPAKR